MDPSFRRHLEGIERFLVPIANSSCKEKVMEKYAVAISVYFRWNGDGFRKGVGFEF